LDEIIIVELSLEVKLGLRKPNSRKGKTTTPMKKHAAKIIVLAFIFMAAGAIASLRAQEAEPPKQPRFRIGIYFQGSQLNDENLTAFFGHSQRNFFGYEASVHVIYNIDVWASYRLYTDETKTSYYGMEDKFRLNQTSLGVVYRPVVWKILEPFVGAGMEIYSYSEEVEGEELADVSGNTIGFHIQGGTYVNIFKFLAGKLFYRLNIAKDTLDKDLPDGTNELDLGGQEFGVGLVFRF
jgi:Outer membrane protein beta-barrel domain